MRPQHIHSKLLKSEVWCNKWSKDTVKVCLLLMWMESKGKVTSQFLQPVLTDWNWGSTLPLNSRK